MSSEISTFYAKQFASGIGLLPQRKGVLRECVDVDTDVREGDRKFYNQLDSSEMLAITNRHGETQYVETPHRRRMVTCNPFEWSDLIDRVDLRRTLESPINGYSKTAAMAIGRKTDDVIIAAFFASASTGVDGGTSTAFATATHQVAVVSGGLAIAQIRDARRILEANENPEDDGENAWFAALGAQQRDDLYNTTEVISSDYNTVKALAQGQVNSFMGFSFKKTQGLGTDGSSDRRCPFWVKSAMKLAIAEETMRPFVDLLPQRRHSTQVRVELDLGATRMNEVGVVEVIADE